MIQHRNTAYAFNETDLDICISQLELYVNKFAVLTQCLFLRFSELQVRVDGVNATSRHRDAVDVAARESTRLAREPRRFRDGINQHRSRR